MTGLLKPRFFTRGRGAHPNIRNQVRNDIIEARMKDKDFLIKLREEMMQTRQKRWQYELAKVTSISALIGTACLILDKTKQNTFFYAIPFITIAFDIYVLGMSFSIKRMGAFVSQFKIGAKDAEFKWEQFVKKYPDKYSSIASLSVTLIVVIGSLLILINSHAWQWNFANTIWLIFLLFALFSVRFVQYRMLNIFMRE